MNIRVLEKNEKQYIKKLYMQSFDDPEIFVDYYLSDYSINTATYACIEDGEIISMANVHYKSITVMSDEYDAAYIYGVATKNEYKKQGIMKKVLRKLIAELERKGIYFIYLIPAIATSVYESLGFRLVREEKIYNIYDKNMSEPGYRLERYYIDAASLKKHIKELLSEVNAGYIMYKVFPIMIYQNDYTRELITQLMECNSGRGSIGENINIDINEITSIDEIYRYIYVNAEV